MASSAAQIVVSLRNNASGEVRKLASDFRGYIQTLRDAGVSQELAERRALSLAQAQAKLLVSSGQATQGERTLIAALSQVDAESTAAARAATQLVTIQNKVRDGAKGAGQGTQGFASALGELKGIAGAFGVGVGLQQLISGGIGAAEQALQLRETKNALKAVAGDTQTYTAILGEARRQQLLFGGSLQENIDGLSGLAVTSRSTGARLETLIDLQKRLAVLNPAQGAAGGLTALNEALAGNVTSLSKRFNIPREELKKLSDESLPAAERLKAIDSFLNKVGITSAAVAGKVDQDAVAFRRLAQEAGDLKTNVGDGLATAFSGAATGLSRLIGLINQNPQALAELKAILGGKGSVTQDDLVAAEQEVARTRASRLLGGNAATPQQRQAIEFRIGGRDELAQVTAQLAELELRGGAAAATGEQVTRQFLQNAISADAYKQQLTALVGGTNESVQATDANNLAMVQASPAALAAAQAAEQYSAALEKDARESATASAKSQLLTLEKQRLEAQATVTAKTLFQAAGSMTEEGIQALISAGKIDELTGAHLRLLAAQQAPPPPQPLGNIGRKNLDIDGPSSLADARAANAFIETENAKAEAAAKAAKAAADARRAQVLALGTDAQKLAQLKKDLADATKLSGAGSAEAIRAATDLQLERQRQAEAAARNARKNLAATGKGLSANDRADLALVDDLDAKHAALLAKLQQGNLTELQRKQILNEIQTVEEKITAEKNKQVQSALDARIAAIEDRKQRRQEDRELNQAQRVLASNASQAFKDAARDQLELIPLQQQRRQLALQQQLREAGPLAGVLPAASGVPALPALPGRGAPAPLPALPTVPGVAGAGALPQVNVSVFLDGKQIAAQVVLDLRGGLDQTRAAGAGRL